MEAHETSRSAAITSPFVFTTTSESPPRSGPFRSNGTGADQLLPESYECHSSGPLESPIATTYWAPRLDVAEVSIAYDGSPPCPPGRTTSAPNDGLPFDAPVAPGTSAAVNATNASMLATRAIPRNRIDPPSKKVCAAVGGFVAETARGQTARRLTESSVNGLREDTRSWVARKRRPADAADHPVPRPDLRELEDRTRLRRVALAFDELVASGDRDVDDVTPLCVGVERRRRARG